ncbi:membrane protein insertase YidC [Methylobacterium sp. WL30]|uniref:membrane protein insertase YidC n=1 Tax=unclassified Methylobacterium TaxID=2615210 RepID=UPI0011C792B4|nr:MULTISPECIES: membrane protein insertase YidC [unclassified Methylobacterium]TXM94175.1 membrane protein insertase YidC [Methylobacterium sp. WL116]TXN42013.1 membrane protein insertase YidC [Methylobacterium sp. WL93]TXN52671.1 membrane protein insertase YidC [Methylobacterium sp. WL119]TXN69965.1 membrane protein insertase YidC [Methylobacterium sp. WL30]
MGNDKTNMFVAIALSLVVLLGWNYFVAAPRVEQQRQANIQNQAAQQSPGVTPDGVPSPSPKEGGPAAPVAGTLPNAATGPIGRTEALARSPRIKIETPALAGSIALKGGRIDDIALKNYHETVDDKSPEIVLLSPAGTEAPYYAEFGWVGAAAGPLPTNDTVWTADGQTLGVNMPVTLSWDNGAGLVFKRILAVDDKYMFTVRDEVENKGANAVTLYPYSLVSRWGKPHTQGYYVLHEGMIGVLGGDGLQEYTYDHLAKEPAYGGAATKGKAWANVTGGFVGITDKYWAAAAIPDQTMSYTGAFTERTDGATKIYQASVRGDGRSIEPGATASTTQRLFAGAKEVNTINGYEKNLGIKQFDLMIDWGWFHFITKPMFRALDFFFHLFGNFGVAILVVTFCLKLLFLPIANRSYVSMAKMKAVQPEMTSIRERYKDDKMKQQQAMMELYKKEKINPVAGCWPVLVQIPVFFALYKVLFITIEMRHAPFFGWIQDLAAPDPTSIVNLFGLLPFAAPDFVHLGIWPIIMGVTMFVQMKMNPAPPDPVQAQIFTFMPIVFTFMLGSFPAGLVIYWAWNNTLSVTQQYVIMRRNGVKVELWDNLRNTFKRGGKTAPAKS